jgi:DNA-binding transcriptional LysR family regulator
MFSLMNWDDLRIFLAVARHGTLAQAGVRLGMDATTVARRLKRLEERLSVTLFEHTPAGHVLTARGTALRDQAQRMEEAATAAVERGGGAAGEAEGIIRVSASEGFGTGFVAPHLADFARRYPGIAVELVASTGFLNPSRREADVAIMLARPERGPLIVRKLTDYHLGLYAAATPGPLPDRFVGYVPDLIYAAALRYIEEVPGAPSATLTSTSVNAQAQMVRSGAGVGILPCFIADPDPALRRLRREEVDIRRAFWLVVHRDMRAIGRIRLFIDWLDDLVARLRPVLLGYQPNVQG